MKKLLTVLFIFIPCAVFAESRIMSTEEALYQSLTYGATNEADRVAYRNALIAVNPDRAAEFGMKPANIMTAEEAYYQSEQAVRNVEAAASNYQHAVYYRPPIQAASYPSTQPGTLHMNLTFPTPAVQHVAVMQPPVEPGPVRSYYDEYYADQIKAEVEHAKKMALLEQRQQERQSAAPREAVVIVTEAADSSTAHIEMQTRNARTTASIPNAMTVTQQDTIAQLAAYQLKIDQQAAKLEQQRQEFLHLQTVLVLAALGSIPLLAALYWTGKQAMHEWRAIQDLRHRQKLEESQAAQKELQAAEHFIEKM